VPSRFVSTLFKFLQYRGPEILLHQAPLYLGIAYGIEERSTVSSARDLIVLVLMGFVLFFAIYLGNDLFELELDRFDPYKPRIFSRENPEYPAFRFFFISLYLLLFLGFAFLSKKAILWGGIVAGLGAFYSLPGVYLKAIPVLATLSHFSGAIALFFLGYHPFHPLDIRGFLFSLFFALLFSSGHITQDLRDLSWDRAGGISTLPHLLGKRRAFFLQGATMGASFLLIGLYCLLEYLPPEGGILILFAFPILFSARKVMKGGVSRSLLLSYQRLYRGIFLGITLVLLFLSPGGRVIAGWTFER
jgi:4-hydroxybenzoate polyprenyltransferase